MFDKYKNYKYIKMPEDMKNGILMSMQEYKPAAKPKLAIKRRILMYATMLVCLTLAVSAAVIVNRTQYVPGVGFTEDEYEIYCVPEAMELLGKVITVESVVRTKFNGKSELSVIITGTSDKNIKIITEDYGEIKAKMTREYSMFNYGFLIEDFPEINEFTIYNNGRSVEVKLEPNTHEAQIVEKNGVKIKMFNLSNKGKIYTFDIEEYNIDIENLLDIESSNQNAKFTHFSDMHLYDEQGNDYSGFRSVFGSGSTEFIMLMQNRPEEKIDKMVINSIDVSYRFQPYSDNSVYADIDLPIPSNGETIEYKDGLLIYDKNGLAYRVYKIKREEDDDIIISGRAEYTGGGSENINNMYVSWQFDNASNSRSWWFDSNTGESGSICKLMPEEQDIDSVRLKMAGVEYQIGGEWEIYFGE